VVPHGGGNVDEWHVRSARCVHVPAIFGEAFFWSAVWIVQLSRITTHWLTKTQWRQWNLALVKVLPTPNSIDGAETETLHCQCM